MAKGKRDSRWLGLPGQDCYKDTKMKVSFRSPAKLCLPHRWIEGSVSSSSFSGTEEALLPVGELGSGVAELRLV